MSTQVRPNRTFNSDACPRASFGALGTRRLTESLGPMVAIRTWLSALVAPILGGAVYAWLTLSSSWPAIVPKYPTVGALIIWASIVCLIFELAIILPLQFALRPAVGLAQSHSSCLEALFGSFFPSSSCCCSAQTCPPHGPTRSRYSCLARQSCWHSGFLEDAVGPNLTVNRTRWHTPSRSRASARRAGYLNR